MNTFAISVRVALLTILILGISQSGRGDDQRHVLEPRMVHLRNAAEREWSNFPEVAEAVRLDVKFLSPSNTGESTLLLRQQDVKQQWFVSLNGKRLGELVRDENDMVTVLAIPKGTLQNGDNSLVIETPANGKTPADDILVGHITVRDKTLAESLSESTLDVTVTDATSKGPLPCRITIVDQNGSLVPFATTSTDDLAIRTGTAFTATGRVNLKLPAGQYTAFAGRGFEYSLATVEVAVKAGESRPVAMTIRRDVPTPGMVACDTHIHTLTHSGHGDATINERMITLAGEGIELPIATDHNVHIDYEPTARKLNVRQHFTPVMGNEVTTARGHFNIFPIQAGARVVDHKQIDWAKLFDDIERTPGVKIAILNHARDLHSAVRPFGPALHNAVVGENLEGWPIRFNAMEVVNSGATQTDVLQLFHDWMGLLNHGYQITPVGSSDSHDVVRFIVGQGRTYIRCDDRDPGKIDVEEAVRNFGQGRVAVSYGLLVDLKVNEKYSSGDLAAVPDDTVQVEARILGPDWVEPDRILLYSNGTLIRDEVIPPYRDDVRPRGIKATRTWSLPRPRHDVHLVAIALGPGIEGLYWRTAKPYQPTSIDPQTHVIGCSGAVWLDGDGDGHRTSARRYAEQRIAMANGDLNKLVLLLADYDEATAAQTAHLLRSSGIGLQEDAIQSSLKSATAKVRAGFQQYQAAWRENEIARAKP